MFAYRPFDVGCLVGSAAALGSSFLLHCYDHFGLGG